MDGLSELLLGSAAAANACRAFLCVCTGVLAGAEKSRITAYERKEVNGLAKVNLRPNESQDQLLRRFRKKVAKSGILSTVRRKRWFVSKSELRRIQKKKAIRRHKRRQSEND